MFDVNKIRKDFPILRQKINNADLVYLDNAASSQKPKAVIDAVSNLYASEYANVHRGIHYLSMKATEKFEHARSMITNFINSPSEEQVIFQY